MGLNYFIELMIKNNLLFFVVLVLNTNSFAQIAESDFNFYSSAPVMSSPEDYILYQPDTYKFYSVEFSDSVLFGIDKVWIELEVGDEGTIVFRKTYAKSILELAPYKIGSTIKIDFGNLEIMPYKLSFLVEKPNKNFSNKITKNLQE